MYFKKSLSLITILVFSLVFCLAVAINGARADAVRTSDQSEDTEMRVGETEEENTAEEGTRTASWYQLDQGTTGWGGTMQQWSFGPDVGYGETGQGYSYTDPLTGRYVSYQTSGMGVGAVPLPTYGGMNSQFGAASYGMFAGGNMPTTTATPGYDTQSSTAGDAFGQGYQYQTGAPNVTAMAGYGLMQNPSTAGLGLAMLYQGSAASSGLGFGSTGYGASALGSFGSFAPTTAFGSGLGFGSSYGLTGGFGAPNPYTANPYSASVYRPTTGFSAYGSTAYPATSGYGYTGGYPATSGYGYTGGYPATSGYGYQGYPTGSSNAYYLY